VVHDDLQVGGAGAGLAGEAGRRPRFGGRGRLRPQWPRAALVAEGDGAVVEHLRAFPAAMGAKRKVKIVLTLAYLLAFSAEATHAA
jgi:hypothetical protein